jgi:hypothetical protein
VLPSVTQCAEQWHSYTWIFVNRNPRLACVLQTQQSIADVAVIIIIIIIIITIRFIIIMKKGDWRLCLTIGISGGSCEPSGKLEGFIKCRELVEFMNSSYLLTENSAPSN